MRIALCISGQMRAYREAYPSIKRHLIDPLRPVIFVHTWSDIGELLSPARMFPKLEVARRHIPSFAGILKKFYDAYAARARSQVRGNRRVDEESLKILYDASEVVVENFPEGGMFSLFSQELPRELLDRMTKLDAQFGHVPFPYRGAFGALPMFYKIWAADQLRRQWEAHNGCQFDIVVRLRPDLHVISPIPEDTLQGGAFGVSVPQPISEFIDRNLRLPDQFFWGDSKIMTHVCDTWLSLTEIYREMSAVDYCEHKGLFGGERVMMHAAHTGRYGDKIDYRHLHDLIIRPRLNFSAVICAAWDTLN